MKMRDIANIIEHHMDLDYVSSTKNGESHFKINQSFKENLSKILEIPCFKANFFDLHKFFLENDIFEFRKNETFNNAMFQKIQYLKTLCELYLDNFEAFYPKIKDTSISLKLQETGDLRKVAITILSLDKALNQMFSGNSLNSSYQLSNFDQGSKWIDVIIEKKEAFACFAAAIGFVVTIANKVQEIRLKEAEIEKIKVQTDLSKKELELLEKSAKASIELDEFLIDKKIETKVKELIDTYYNSEENAELPFRLKLSIKELLKINLEENSFRPTDLIAYNIPENSLNPWGYIECIEKKQIEYKNTENINNFENN